MALELDYDALTKLTLDFTNAFNRNDLEGVMSYFAGNAVYDQFDGSAAHGLAAIRKAFGPQFEGAFGKMQFEQEDIFVDAAARKSMISWTCTLETARGPAGWRGLDLLHFDERGRITAKLTYAKTKSPLLAAASK